MKYQRLPIFLICFAEAVLVLVILINFRRIRTLFPITGMGSSESVGFAQYYGYSMWFEPVIFGVVVLSPAFFSLCLGHFFKFKK